ncbi:putative ArsR family transcriptional regulator [Microbacterium terrae]|uniref:Helix-turn-helix domain protein n=1 Tax=Microbacterium terrae TaxID=69369 RepID=A0A0M2H8P4_9MICO|nr:winged helix-turn-helix domain-containing protein [Microbacterium terrae]KJL40509.1 Helix-turn-helix domain protein [Microbacterium terrae]MBP1079166.1 putative ArsR family transcriptional regulator [Microbacterium terrae]GLJ98567.1 ArsR family transcriptional regulator [Microbacterium terrae]
MTGQERSSIERSVVSVNADDAEVQARARALSSPVRMRILRLCAFESRTNKELAELLGVNPGTMLHHVRTLVQTGYLAAQPERAGAQGAREVPYRATGLSWRTSIPEGSHTLVATFLQQIEGLRSEDLDIAWMGLKLNAEHRVELERRLYALLDEFRERGPDADGDTYSLFTALHPDHNPPSGR